MQRLAGNDLPLTQEFLAQMMGVQRTSVTTIAGSLQKLGMITYSRGHIHINDIEMVRQHACEVRRHDPIALSQAISGRGKYSSSRTDLIGQLPRQEPSHTAEIGYFYSEDGYATNCNNAEPVARRSDIRNGTGRSNRARLDYWRSCCQLGEPSR